MQFIFHVILINCLVLTQCHNQSVTETIPISTASDVVYTSCITTEGNDITDCEIYKSIQLVDEKLTKLTTLMSNCGDSNNRPPATPNEHDLDSFQKDLKEFKEVAKQVHNLKLDFSREFLQFQEKVKNELNEYKKEMFNLINGYKTAVDRNSAAVVENRNNIANCVSDIRFSGQERNEVYGASGFSDTAGEGYVITEVFNWNRDPYVNYVSRRKLSMRKGNGQWSHVHV